MVTFEGDRVGVTPDLAPVGERQAAERVPLVVAVVVEDIDAPGMDGGTSVAFAEGNGPQGNKRPLTEALSPHRRGRGNWVRRNAIAVGTAETRPATRQVGGETRAKGQFATGIAGGFFFARKVVGPR